MRTTTIFATLAIPATAVGLFAQENITIRSAKVADEGIVLAQGAVGMVGLSGQPGNVRFMTQEFSFSGRAVTGQPYSGEETTESVQTLADGNHITNTTTTKVYRDSQGRTRREMTLPSFGGSEQHIMITINDPVKGVNYTLDPQSKTAHQMPGPEMMAKIKADGRMNTETRVTEAGMSEAKAKLKAEAEARAGAGSRAIVIRQAPASNAKHEDLGANVIEGVNVNGTRESSTIEAGAMGNEKPISITSERWYSQDLGVEVKSVHNDPRMGQTTHTLTNVSRTEPDASLFQVPSDYKMDEPGPGMAVQHFEYHTNQ
jgi:hypothetical protein